MAHQCQEPVKACTMCNMPKALTAFGKRSQAADGRDSWCRDCKKTYSKTPEARLKRRDRQLKELYGLTPAEFDAMIAVQQGLCVICGEVPKTISSKGRSRRPFCVDHDPSCCPGSAKSCGECVRALLCWRCNIILGHVKENAKLLRSMADYLEMWESFRTPEDAPPVSYNDNDINGSEIQRAFGVMSVRQGVGWHTNVRNA